MVQQYGLKLMIDENDPWFNLLIAIKKKYGITPYDVIIPALSRIFTARWTFEVEPASSAFLDVRTPNLIPLDNG